jgi:two-component system cell cycle sensor histidine kinase/response regulator CckA
MTITPLRNADGVIARYIAIKQDISDRKRAEEALRQSEEQFRAMFDLASVGIAQADPRTGQWVRVNRKMCEITGYSAGELLQMLVADITHPEDRLSDRESFERVVRGEAPDYRMEKRYIRKDGVLAWVNVNMTVIRDAAGQPIRTMAAIEDITERKRLEAHSFQSQKMETVGKLAGGIAHEFNSIMTAILGQSELMLSDLPEGNPLRKNAIQIHQAADRAATLTRQLLAYGGKQILQPDVLDLNTVLAGMENTLRHLAGRDVDVRIAPSPGPKLVKADPGQIEQVIVNIVMNAADAMPHGGKLTLETGETFLDQKYVGQFHDLKAGEYVMLAITDTGAGMSQAIKARLFEPFFTTKGVGQGTGLGLATCHGIIKQSGGQINVYSEPGRGATFKIYLPKARLEEKPPGPPLQSPGLPRGTETILLVEDDPALREMAAELLGRLGYTVLTASDGLEALNVTNQHATGHIDLLFTDVVMPHMSGKELADRVRALYPHTRILFTSAYTENAIVHQGVLNPGILLLQKPFTPSALAHKVREVLDQLKTPEN